MHRKSHLVRAAIAAVLLLIADCASAQAPVPARSLRGRLLDLLVTVNTAAGIGVTPGDVEQVALLAQLTSLEVSVAPTGTSSGGFTFTFDSQLGTFKRSTQSFGPAFGKRSTTIGKGKFSAGFNWLHAGYDSIGGMSLTNGDLRPVQNAFGGAYSELRLDLTSDTYVGFATFGVTNDLEIGAAVPWVRIALAADVGLFDPAGNDVTPEGRIFLLPITTAAGVGDIALFGKYHVWRQQEGGVAAEIEVHLPSGDTNALRGTGVTRTLVSGVWSRGGVVSPHASVGYEFWSRGVRIGDVSAKNQITYACGLEFRAHSRATVLADVIGRRQLNAGQLGYRTVQLAPDASLDALVALPKRLDAISFAPGIKWNAAGNVLLTANVITAIANKGLRANVIPVVGVDWAF